MKIDVGDIEIEVIKKDIKNIHLSVYPPDGKVRLTSPKETTDSTIRLYAISKLSWIKRQKRRFGRQDRQPERNYIDRETHYYQGKNYLLKVIENSRISQVIVKNKTTIEIHTKNTTSIKQREVLLNDFYRSELKKQVDELIKKWEKIIGVQVEDYGVKQMKTKWGSCNIEAKRIWINLELAKKPTKCLEYLVVHEMVHLLERKHNDFFLSYMNKFLPNWKQLKAELNRLPVSHLDWEY